MHILPVALLLLGCWQLPAQTVANPVSYPNDTIRADSANLVPLGFNPATGAFDEGRWQQWIPARALPSGGAVFKGLAVHCPTSSANVTYRTLKITLSHTTATKLQNSFATNLSNPAVVLNATDRQIKWGIQSWVTIPFATPFPYNGTDHLVVEIVKVYDRVTHPVPGLVTHQTAGPPHRIDLLPAIYAASAFGAGGSTATNASTSSTAVLALRLMTESVPSTTVASLSLPRGLEFGLGTPMSLTTWGAAGTAYGTLLDTRLRTPISIPGISGLLLLNPNFMLTSGITGSNNAGTLTLQVPTNQAFVATYWVLQSVTLNPAKTDFAMTNVADLYITK